jgi:iron complex transport system ATP-binding protein
LKLTAENLTAGYKEGFHIREINLRVEDGGFIGIIGPNGSGKTTLLKAFTKVLRPERGRIFMDKEDLSNLGFKDAAKKFAVVPQTIAAAYISVEDYVLMGRLPYFGRFQLFETAKDRNAAGEYMEITGITRIKDKFMAEVSGGEKQLAAIARALTQETEILFLDEPTSHLDIKHQIGIMDLLREMNLSKGLTVVCILHDLNLAGEYCSNLILMESGKVFKSGKPKEVLAYKTIENVYDTVVVVTENPVSGKPFVVPVSGKMKKFNPREKRKPV